jgi:hypothetical protein
MTGKRSMPHVWWARRETLLAVGGTVLAVWKVLGAWMQFAPRDHDRGDFGPDQTPTQPAGVQPTQQTSTDSVYDPSVYKGPLNTPTFSARPSPQRTNSPSGSATSTAPTSTTSEPPPPPASSTSGPGNGNGHGHGHGH